jgi:N-acetylmuramoyl-L-alanine amidase
VGGSSPNNARSPSGVLEKDLTLDMARRIRDAIVERATAVQVELTRSTDVNLGLADRARLAARTEADVFLSLHFNGFNGVVRGTESHVRPKASGNVNLAEDRRFAERVLQSAHGALRELDPNAKNRGVFEKSLGVLRDDFLGNTPSRQPCRACLLELEFLDVPEVDALFNTGPKAEVVKHRVATAIAAALIEEVGG